jgi:tetratricopeptide (TPR) repeat protein
MAAVGPQIAGSIRTEAFGYYYKNDFENASILLEKAYFFNTEDSEAIYFAAVSYYNAGDKVKAKALYQFVSDTYPGTYIQSMSDQALEQIESENG